MSILYVKHFTAKIGALAIHYEIIGSYLQQHNQHHVFRAHFEADSHIQGQTKKEQRLSSQMSRSKLVVFVVTDNTALACSDS